MPIGLFDDPKRFYDRGAELRALADLTPNVDAKAALLRAAADYDKLGDRALERMNAKQKDRK